MDHCYLEELFGGREFPDGTFAIDHIDEIIEHQKVFMEVVAETREELMMTYPVLTYSLLFKDGKFVDEEFARWCSDHNTIWYDSNFYNGSDVTSLSNCCFDKNQKVLVKNGETVILESFGNLEAECYKDFRKDMEIFHNGNWVSGKLIKLPASKMYKVTTVNNKTMILTDNHINPTMLGNKETKDLTTDDYLLFNIRVLGSIYPTEKQLKYFHGALIGLYMKYGSMISDTDIMFTVDHRLYSAVLSILKSIVKTLDPESVDHITCEVSDDESTPNYINIYSKSIHDFINLYVTHYYEKSLNMQVLLQSLEFRMGILGGMIEDDKNPHYTETSISNADKVEALLSSVGASTRIEEVKVSKNGSEYIEYHIYSYHIYEDRYVEDTYRVCNNSVYFKIKSIEEISNYNEKYVYCFEMRDKDEPYFTLPNGIITHNCRLISDTSKLDPFINSIGGTSLSIGSVKVNTINLRRIALESDQDEEKFINILKERIDTTVKTLDVIRHIIMRNIEKGLLPNYSYKLIEIDKQYNTIGITAMFEALKEFDYIDCDEFGNYSYSDKAINFAQKIMNTINEQKESYNFDYRLNVENIPKMCGDKVA